MPDFCSAFGCSHERNTETKKQGITFHKFPKDKRRRQAWVDALRRRDFVPKDCSVVCSRHFNPEDFDRTGQSTRLKEGVIPSIFNFPDRLCKVPSRPRAGRTSQQAAAGYKPSHSRSPSHSPSRSPSRSPGRGRGGLSLCEKATSDHPYAFDPVKAKEKWTEAQQKLEELQRSLRNARDRERRQKKTMKFLLDTLEDKKNC
ncbi:THAP domain-containing protein 2-like isoform X2 [Melanotaenia boesemani]|uniref:THAP domain-containing protein 2-like isoform X2 n=1 Tax=Melanotaenia boesemani TaxID=1250792 RepID=UPI001C03A558|nr:THAP domain-containing protein 2-like isoform X2 [Melanotaenia boesemani]